MPSPVTTTRRLDTFVLQEEKMILVGQKDKTQAVERPPGDVHYAWWPLM